MSAKSWTTPLTPARADAKTQAGSRPLKCCTLMGVRWGVGRQPLAPMATGKKKKKNQLNEDKQEASELPPTPLKRQEA